MIFSKQDRADLQSLLATGRARVLADAAKDKNITDLRGDLVRILPILERLALGEPHHVYNVVNGVSDGGFARLNLGVENPPEPRDPLEPYYSEVAAHAQANRCTAKVAYKQLRIERLRAAIGASAMPADEKKIWLQNLDLIHNA